MALKIGINPQTAQVTKTEKPNQKLARSAKPEITTPLLFVKIAVSFLTQRLIILLEFDKVGFKLFSTVTPLPFDYHTKVQKAT